MSGPEPEAPAAPSPARSHRARWAALAVVLPLLGLIAVLATRPSAASRVADSPLLGKPAPEISGRTIDGETVRLADYRGKWVLVNFFATWCVPCRKEHPELIAFHQRHRSLGDLEVLGVIYSDATDEVLRFRRQAGGEWPMLEDPKGRIAVDLGVSGVPESFLISPDGVVVSKLVGGVRATDLEDLLARAKASSTWIHRGGPMEKLVYLLLGPVGCVTGVVVWIAILARRRRRADTDAVPAGEVAALRGEVAELRAERSEAGNG